MLTGNMNTLHSEEIDSDFMIKDNFIDGNIILAENIMPILWKQFCGKIMWSKTNYIFMFEIIQPSTNLTHWGRDKMAAIRRQHFQMYFP